MAELKKNEAAPQKIAGTKPPAVMQAKNDMPDEDDSDASTEHEEDPEPPKKKDSPKAVTNAEDAPKLVRRELKGAPIVNKAQPRKAFILDKKGQKQPDPEERGKFLMYESGEYVRHVGYVNQHGVLFPCGFRFKGGHIGDCAPEYAIVLNNCPKCGHKQGVDEAVQGACQNLKVRSVDGEFQPCGYSALDELDSYDIEG